LTPIGRVSLVQLPASTFWTKASTRLPQAAIADVLAEAPPAWIEARR